MSTGYDEKSKRFFSCHDGRKEIAGLRWEYLLRSEGYKEFCIWKRSNPTDYRKRLEVNEEYSFVRYVEGIEFPLIDKTKWGGLFDNYGDIHSMSFEYYWKVITEDLEKRKDRQAKEEKQSVSLMLLNAGIREYNTTWDIDNALDYFKRKGKDPSIQEIKEHLHEDHKAARFIEYHLVIRRPVTISDVKKSASVIHVFLKKSLRHNKRFVKQELERYLKVYDMRKQVPPIPYRDIHKKLYPRIEFTDNTRRARINDFNRARVIISNVEADKLFYW